MPGDVGACDAPDGAIPGVTAPASIAELGANDEGGMGVLGPDGARVAGPDEDPRPPERPYPKGGRGRDGKIVGGEIWIVLGGRGADSSGVGGWTWGSWMTGADASFGPSMTTSSRSCLGDVNG